MEKIRFGEKLKQLREQNGVSQEEFAGKINVTRQAVSHWENEKRLPDIYMIRTIAEYYGITIDELCGNVVMEEKISVDKLSGRLISASIILSFIYMAVGIAAGNFSAGIFIIMIICSLFCAGITHMVFKGVIEDNNMGLMAGYDAGTEYNMPVVKKIIKQCDVHIAYMTLAVIALLFASAYTDSLSSAWKNNGKEDLFSLHEILAVYYCIDFVVTIMFYNFKSRNVMFKNDKDLIIAKAGWVSLVWYIIMIFGIIGTILYKAAIREISNNTPGAYNYIGWLLLFILITTAELAYEQHRAKKQALKDGGYHVGAAFWSSTIAAIAIAICI